MRMSMSKWEAITSVAEKLGPTPERSASGFVRLNVTCANSIGELASIQAAVRGLPEAQAGRNVGSPGVVAGAGFKLSTFRL